MTSSSVAVPSQANNNNLPLHSAQFSSLLPVGGSFVTAQTAVLGAVVQRGPHYDYGNEQDGGEGKTGALLNIIRVDSNANDQSKSDGSGGFDETLPSLLGKVKWAETGVVGLYRLGPHQFDLVFAEIMIPVHLDGMPVDVNSGGAILGAAVSRNPEFWCWGDQDGTRGGHVVRVENELGFVTVKWGDESIFRYRAGGKLQQQSTLQDSSTSKPICDLLYGERWNKKMDSTPVYLHEKNILSGCENSNLSNFPTTTVSFSGANDGDNDPTSPMRNQIRNDAEDDGPGVASETQFPFLQKLSAQQIVISRTLPKESDPVSVENFRPGARVIRGPNWRQSIYGDQDLECGGWGILRSCDAKEKFVRVKWANGVKRNYRAGIDSAYDLQYDANPLSPIRITATSSSTNWNHHHIDDNNSNNDNLSSRRYHFSAAPSNVILAYNESRRRQLQAFVDFNIREKRKKQKELGDGKRQNNGNEGDFNIDDNYGDDDDAFDVTSICTTLTEQGEYTELFSFYGFTVNNTNRNKQNKINITANPNDDDDDDDQTSLDTDSIFVRGGDDTALVKLRDDDLSSLATYDYNGRRKSNHKNDDDDDDDDLSSVVSNFSCFKVNYNDVNATNHRNNDNKKALVNFIPREMEVLNRKEHDIMTENDNREDNLVSANSNNSVLSQRQQELASPPLRPAAATTTTTIANKNNNNKNNIQISELCLKCKERARIYGNVPCGHVTLCPFCVAEELLKMEMNCKKNTTNRSSNDKKQNQGCFCLVCNQPVEMVIKIFK